MKIILSLCLILLVITLALGADSELATWAGMISPGQWVNFTRGINPLTWHQYEISWQTIWHYDAGRKEAQYMGKPQSNLSLRHSHYIYEEATNTYRTTGQSLFQGTGHIWSSAYDPGSGDFFFHRWADNNVRWMKYATESWTTTSSTSLISSGSVAPANGMAYHPNLFGQGEGGLVLCTRSKILAWRRSNDSWSTIKSLSGGEANFAGGSGIYLPGFDAVLIGTGDGGPLWRLGAGSGGATGTPINLGRPPRNIAGVGQATASKLIQDPNDDSNLLLLEYNGTQKVWTSTDGGDNWTEESYQHGFDFGSAEFIVTPVTPYGVCWAITSHFGSRLWKPPTSTVIEDNGALVQENGPMISFSPHPFNSKIKIAVSRQLSAISKVNMHIYNVNGKIVKKLTATDSRQLIAGITWNASKYPSGIYVLRIQVGRKAFTRPIILQR
jgi:hypothetical protein